MFQAQTEHWEETQERMSQSVSLRRVILDRPLIYIKLFALFRSATPIYNNRGGAPRRSAPVAHVAAQSFESKPLPAGYICHRCSKRGL